jgi:hypothetical protein
MQPIKLKKREISKLSKHFNPDTHAQHVFKCVAHYGRRTKQQLLAEHPRPHCNPGREFAAIVNPKLKEHGLAVYSTKQPGQTKPEYVLFSVGGA